MSIMIPFKHYNSLQNRPHRKEPKKRQDIVHNPIQMLRRNTTETPPWHKSPPQSLNYVLIQPSSSHCRNAHLLEVEDHISSSDIELLSSAIPSSDKHCPVEGVDQDDPD